MARSTSRSSLGRRRAAVTRRYPRFHLDVDWFVESDGCSAMGRGLELSARNAMLPVSCRGSFPQHVTLHIAFPLRERMFKAHCLAARHGDRGWSLTFQDVTPEDLQLLGHILLSEFGVAALPNLERRPSFTVDEIL